MVDRDPAGLKYREGDEVFAIYQYGDVLVAYVIRLGMDLVRAPHLFWAVNPAFKSGIIGFLCLLTKKAGRLGLACHPICVAIQKFII